MNTYNNNTEIDPNKALFDSFIVSEVSSIDPESPLVYLPLLKIIYSQINLLLSKSKNERKKHLLESIEQYIIDEATKTKTESIILPSEASSTGLLKSDQMPTIKLKEIHIVNFRGFQCCGEKDHKQIDFHDKATIFYATNGGGKTSISEAIEWCVLGDCEERISRGVDNCKEYFQNSSQSARAYTETEIYLTNGEKMEPSQIYQKCFLEKNRISQFGRIPSLNKKNIREIIAELFGLHDFDSFVAGFVSPDNFTYTDSEVREKKPIWDTWNRWDFYKQYHEETVRVAESELKEYQGKMANMIPKEGILSDYINKLRENEAKLREKKNKLDKDYSIEFSTNDFRSDVEGFLTQSKRWEQINAELLSKTKELDYEQLFSAADKLFEHYEDEKCPLCETPFAKMGQDSNHVAKDPREKTRQELEKLNKLKELRQEKEKIERFVIGEGFRSIRDAWAGIVKNTYMENYREINVAKKTLPSNFQNIDFAKLETLADNDLSEYLKACQEAFRFNYEAIEILEGIIKDYKNKRKNTESEKIVIETELKKLSGEILLLEEAQNEYNQKCGRLAENNKHLQKHLEQRSNAELAGSFREAYKKFVIQLESYKTKIIFENTKNIDSLVLGFYKAFNSGDSAAEQIVSLEVPKNESGRFFVTCNNDSSNKLDALIHLSEGHLRTLGLAMLLARAYMFGAPFLIFDDVVNAIDSDHRDNIARLFSGKFSESEFINAFDDDGLRNRIRDYINNVQLIITSHDRFFDEKISNLFGKDMHSRYILYFDSAGVDYCEKEADYEGKIQEFLSPSVQDIRSAMFYCRIWFEEIVYYLASEKNYPFDGRKFDKKTRQLKQPSLEIVLEKLARRMKNEQSEDEKKIGDIIEKVLEQKEGDYLWLFNILNQESHNRRFDHVNIQHAPSSSEVETIYETIKKIKSLVKN